jgi:hypothetical protein
LASTLQRNVKNLKEIKKPLWKKQEKKKEEKQETYSRKS